LIDWRRTVSFSVSHVACATCGLTASQVGIDAVIDVDRIQEHDAHVVIDRDEFEVDYIEPRDASVDLLIGVRVRHVPTGITIEARSRDHRSDNAHAALQALALQLVERARLEAR